VPLLDLVPRSFGEYEAAGGGRGLQTALAAWPVAVIQEVARSGLRGRGGAGFPTGEKWRAVRTVGAGPPVCGLQRRRRRTRHLHGPAAASDQPLPGPGGPGHRRLRDRRERAYIGLKEAFTTEIQALNRALGEMQDADALGGIQVEIVLGPDLYLLGEETGLEEVIEGRLPLPRVARPFIQGLFARPPQDNPTLVNNVETLANVPHILAEGPDWLRANGTEGAPGTMVFTICGDVRHEGVFELPLGSPLRYLVEELAGGPPQGRALKAIFPGASNTVISPAQLDTPMDFDSMRQVGSGLGAAGLAVFDDSACMVQAGYWYSRFLFVESCGQCPACKFGTGEVTDALGAIEAGGGSDRDLEFILVRARGSTRWAEVCPAHRGEPAHAEPGRSIRRRVWQAHREVMSAAPGPALPQDRRLGRHRRTVRLRPGIRRQAIRLDLPFLTALPPTAGLVAQRASSWPDPRWSLTRLLPERPFKQILVDLGVE
jgi:NADH-quinone oxidoreductase subunit F